MKILEKVKNDKDLQTKTIHFFILQGNTNDFNTKSTT